MTLALLSVHQPVGFVWPGMAPREFTTGEVVPMLANRLTSVRTQIPRSFYALPFCVPTKTEHAPESLGEVMHGNLVQSTAFHLRIGLERTLALCKVTLENPARLTWAKRVREDYRAHLLLDNLPVATRLASPPKSQLVGRPDADAPAGLHYERGYSLGYVQAPGVRRLGRIGTAYVNNHFSFTVGFFGTPRQGGSSAADAGAGAGGAAPGSDETIRIVSFEVVPHSVKYAHDKKWPEGFEGADGEAKDALNVQPSAVGLRALDGPLSLDDPETREIVFTYNVTWLRSDIPYSSRWDLYMFMAEGQNVHWFSLTGSLAVSLALAALVAAIMVRTVRRDLRRYNAVSGDEDELALLHEVGWKYCHADVLRPPPHPLLLAASVGGGVQLACMTGISLLLSLLGFLSPTVRGRLLTAALLLYGCAGAPAGYAAARLYRQMHGRDVYELVLLAVGLFPGCFLLLFVLLDLLLWANGASSAVPFSTMLVLLLLFGGLHTPLVVLGARAGLRVPRTDDPVFTNAIPRQIPFQRWYARAVPAALFGGLMPFGSGCYELGVLLSCVWTQRIYYVFSFLLLMAVIMAVICAEVGVVLAYFQLCREDYRWWWRAFANTATTGLYFFCYALAYQSELQLSGGVARVLYLSYTGAAAVGLGLMTGTVGLLAAYWFVRAVFAAVKVD